MSIDISQKPDTIRHATASGVINLSKDTITRINTNNVEKGDVYSSARLAAIQAVKQTPTNLFHCHPIPIYGVGFKWTVSETTIKVETSVKTTGKTGCEMEALSGVSTSLLMIWDMVKMYEKDDTGNYPDTSITDVQVNSKLKQELK